MRRLFFSGVLYFGLLTNSVGLSSSFSSDETDDISHWLMTMRSAAQTLNYDGVFVYVYGSTIEAMRVVHKADGDMGRERIYALNGAPREVIKDSERVWCYIPDKQLGVHEYRQVTKQSFPSILPEQLQKLTGSYKFAMTEEGERIADRNTRAITINPKDELRYGYALWADAETGLLLKAALLDTDMKPIEQYMFTKVSIGIDIPDRDLDPMTPRKDLVWYGSDQEEGVDKKATELRISSYWEIASIPKGFELSRSLKRKSPMRKRMVEHYVYTDGLAAVSVFIEKKMEKTGPIIGINRMGAMHAFGKIVDGHQIIVVGEVPAKTVKMIGDSVQRRMQGKASN